MAQRVPYLGETILLFRNPESAVERYRRKLGRTMRDFERKKVMDSERKRMKEVERKRRWNAGRPLPEEPDDDDDDSEPETAPVEVGARTAPTLLILLDPRRQGLILTRGRRRSPTTRTQPLTVTLLLQARTL